MKYQQETTDELNKLDPKSLAFYSHSIGLNEHEPLIICMDALLRYAKAYGKRFGSDLAEDYFLGKEWLNAIVGIRNLLNGDGAVAMENNITTDTKNNGCIEGMFWSALDIAGFTEEDI